VFLPQNETEYSLLLSWNDLKCRRLSTKYHLK
jgi:hypothetical protein